MTDTPNTQAPPANNNSVKRFTETTINTVLAKIEDFNTNGNLHLPQNYSAENALRSAWLLIQQTQDLNKKPALEVCTTESIGNALFDMVLQGLSPAKKQCYFIVYGNKLNMQRSYFGTIAISKRVAGVKDVVGVPIFQNDVFKYAIDVKTGKKTVTEHTQDFENVDPQKIKGAYAVVTYEDGTVEYEIMTWNQIWQSWQMSPTKGNSPAHKNFPDQMACRTVISRALKLPVNSSNDDDLFDEPEQSTFSKQVEEDVKQKINDNSNGAGGKQPIGFDETEDTIFTEDTPPGNEYVADGPPNITVTQEDEKEPASKSPADLFTPPASEEKTTANKKTERKKHF